MPDAMDNLTVALLGSLPARLIELKLSLEADVFNLDDIPPALTDRFIAQDGRARVDVYPAGDMRLRSDLERFVEDVRAVAPYATGAPVTILEAGNTVIRAFIQAAATSLILIAGLVILFTRRMRDIVLIIIPLFVAAVMTGGASGLLELPFNFANVIVLPLLFGLGIAGNIHLVIRERQTSGTDALMASSTPRAIVFSALTTIGSFCSISLSSHPGTASMGILLTIAIVSSLLCSLILLPALMGIWPAMVNRERSQRDTANGAIKAQSRSRPKPLFPLIRHISVRTTPMLLKTTLTANQVTLISMLLGLTAAGLFAQGDFKTQFAGSLVFLCLICWITVTVRSPGRRNKVLKPGRCLTLLWIGLSMLLFLSGSAGA